jgi:Polyketide cyclase / dehydrase and lipid transport
MLVVYIILGCILGILLLAYLMPSKYMVEKSTIIKKSVVEVMEKVGDLNFYSQWNPWQQMDPTAKSNITGTPKTVGHKYEWEGKKVGVGSLTINSIDEKHIHFNLEFIKPFSSKAKDNWLFEEWGDGSEAKITWQNSGELPWPMARLMGPYLNKQLNQQFEAGLRNLKKMCEG